MTLFRFRLARAVLIFGIWLLPSGHSKRELLQLLDVWTTKVRKCVDEALAPTP